MATETSVTSTQQRHTRPPKVHAHTDRHTQNAAMVTGLVHSPLWMRRCSFRWCLYLNALPHSVHLNLRLPPDCVMCLCRMRGEGTFSETHNENTTFELLLIHVTMSLINRGQRHMFICYVWKQAAKETGLSFDVRLHNGESLCQE